MAFAADGSERLASPLIRIQGGKVVGSKGSGKTLYAAWQVYRDLVDNGYGSIVIDPLGKMTEYLAHLFAYGSSDEWGRFFYIPVGGIEIDGETWLSPMPFLAKDGELQDRTARVTNLWHKLYPEQENAPILGMPQITGLTNYAGMLLAAMGCQLVPDAKYLLRHPAQWRERIEEVAEAHEWELAAPAHYFLEIYPKLSNADKRSETLTFTRLLDRFELNPRLMAQYGANYSCFPFGPKIAGEGMLVIFDCSRIPIAEKRLAMTWIFENCMEFFRTRPYSGGSDAPVGFVIDELSFLASRDNDLLEDDFEELYTRLSRNYKIMPLVTYQSVLQPSERMQGILEQTGFSLFGSVADPAAALKLAELVDDFDPLRVKDRRTQWHQEFEQKGMVEVTYQVPEDVFTYYTPEEQLRMAAKKHRQRPGMTFALMRAPHSGAAAEYVGEVDLSPIRDAHRFDYPRLEEALQIRAKRLCQPVSRWLTEIKDRQPQPEALVQAPPPVRDAPQAPVPQPLLFDQPPPRRSRN